MSFQENRHEGSLLKLIDLAKRLAGEVSGVPLAEQAIERAVCASFLRIDAEGLRVQMISLSLRIADHVKGFGSCSNESVVLVVDLQDYRERST